ncbi:hypothetical protein TEA_003404 [Camellia sinensis var. sinensis]|uniref:Lipoxygenase n=1 Tax=Camellia sinensis var. sinensis TaxID=542762 RepID=A0A4S4DBX2_CAMSN|nr:hypothetical protein TEA_003404 [Camellia sinensis var. sinensis]
MVVLGLIEMGSDSGGGLAVATIVAKLTVKEGDYGDGDGDGMDRCGFNELRGILHSLNPNHAQANGIKGQLKGEFVPRYVDWAKSPLVLGRAMDLDYTVEWPLKSKLAPKIYGPPESAITKELIERQIRGFMTLEESAKGQHCMGRGLFFLTPDGTLRPLAIELTRPPVDGKPQWKQVFTPTGDATGCWLWRLAKVHALAHDSGYHQLVSHWLRTHCMTEPYIIASNRQLSAMHPIYKLLHPHFRYTMEINALARQALINAGGIIETCFSPKKYSIELSSVAYDQQWRFDLQALPTDLISSQFTTDTVGLAVVQPFFAIDDFITLMIALSNSQGMAVEDPTALHGLRLTIEDYPFANDGLLVWDAIKQWVTDYVKHYYLDASFVQSDKELQAWWTEIRTVGHGDKKDETWWPVLKTPQDLIGILTTMIWVTSGHHSAVNFGQYIYAGYFPNRPTIARTKMPTEDPTDEEWKCFINNPEVALLMCFPSQIQATKVMAVLDVLSNHSTDEEYLGKDMEASWIENPIIKAAFERFNGKLKELEGVIDRRNVDKNLKNRCGAGVVPYELLKPFSEPGVTGRGVPNSISI